MANKTELKMGMDFSPLKAFQRRDPKNFKKAQKKAGIQFLNWANNGSKRTSKKPPIRFGILRGSSSVFIGKDLVETFSIIIKAGTDETISPARSHLASPKTLTFVWNTDYATKMHEHKGGWGKFTQQDGDAGRKWLEEHLKRDRNDLFKMIRTEYQKAAGI